MAVPVVANFVVQTVTGLLSTMATERYEKARDRRAPTDAEQRKFHSHAYNVETHAERLRKEKEEADAKDLAEEVLELAVRLEAQARTLLIEVFPTGTKEQILLRADRNVQLRALRIKTQEANRSNEQNPNQNTSKAVRALAATVEKDAQEADDEEREEEEGKLSTLEQVRRYRQTYAGLLAAGTRLLELEGDEQWKFERRIEGEHERDHGGIILGSGRKGPAEEALGVDV